MRYKQNLFLLSPSSEISSIYLNDQKMASHYFLQRVHVWKYMLFTGTLNNCHKKTKGSLQST